MHNASSEPEYKTRGTAWAVTWSLVTELWPGWGATDDQRRIWERLFAWRGQEFVRAAIERVFAEKSLSYPRPGYVLEILKGHTPQHGSAERYEFSDSEIADVVGDDQDMVDDLMELPPEYLQEVLVEGFAAYLMIEIGVLGPEEQQRIRIQAQTQAKDLPTDVSRWDSQLRGLVWAAWEKRRTGGSEDAQGRGVSAMPRGTSDPEDAQPSSAGLWSGPENRDTSA